MVLLRTFRVRFSLVTARVRPSFERTRAPCCLIPQVKAIRVRVRSLDSLVCTEPGSLFCATPNPHSASGCRQVLLVKEAQARPLKMYSNVPPSLSAPRYRNRSTDIAGTASKTVNRIVASSAWWIDAVCVDQSFVISRSKVNLPKKVWEKPIQRSETHFAKMRHR
jgi:hypothetical protein